LPSKLRENRSYPDPGNPNERKDIIVKLRACPHVHILYLLNCPAVSQDTANYGDAPTEGIRRVLEIVTGETIPRGSVLDTSKIGS
jgi:5-oxoprolinase (ATP-hydrolysing)